MRWFLPALLACLAVVAGGCGVDENAIARVDGAAIATADVQAYFEAVSGDDWADLNSRTASRLLDQYLVQEAVIRVLGDAQNVADDASGRSAAVRRLAMEHCGPPPTVTPEDLAAATQKRMDRKTPEQVKIRQLLVDSREEADTARKRLQAGEDFVALSREISRAPNADSGGDIGWVVRGTQPEVVEDVIFGLAPGEVSQPVEGPAGYHVFQVLERRAPGPVPGEEAERDARQALESRAARDHLRRCMDDIVARAKVEVFDAELWFDYSGRFAED